MEKSFYYVVTWDDASMLTKTLAALDIQYEVEQPGGILPLKDGELAIVFPDLQVRQFNDVRELFGGVGERYPG